MASNVGSIAYDLKLDTTKFDVANAKVKGQLNSMSTHAGASANDMNKANSSAGAGFMGTAGKVALTATAIAGLGLIAGKLAGGFISIGSEAQNLRTNLDVLTGSTENGAKMYKQLVDFAGATPFETTELVQATSQMLSFGITTDKVMPYLKSLGDVSMGNKDKLAGLTYAFSQVQSTGRLMGQDLLQMINNGFNPLEVISKKTGKSMATLKDEMEKGKISAQDVADAFTTATSEGGRFYQGMDKGSKTLSGRMSTLRDNAKTAIRAMIGIDEMGNVKEGGIFDKVSKAMEKLFPIMEKMAKEYGPAIGKFIGQMGDAFMLLLTNMKPVFDYIRNNDTLFQALKWTLIAIAVAIGVILVGAFGILVGVMVLVKAVIEASLWLWNGLVAVFEWVITAVMKMIAWVGNLWREYVKAFTNVYNAVVNAFNAVIAFHINVWNSLWNTTVNALNAILNFHRNIWNSIYNTLVNIGNMIIRFHANTWNWLIGAGRAIVAGLANGIAQMVGHLWNTVANVSSNIGRFFAGAGGWLWGAGTAIIQGLINGMGAMAGAVYGKARDIANTVKNTISDALKIRSPSRVMFEMGTNVGQGLVNGIDATMSKIQDMSNAMAVNVQPNIGANTAGASGTAVSNNIYGNITLGDQSAVDRFFEKLNRNGELAQKGLAVN